jgi:hypothetical protein
MGRPLKRLIAICTIGFVVGMVIHAMLPQHRLILAK